MEAERPYVLTIAGFDPSAGAGILADIKTFELHKVYGQAVCTSVTFQNEKEFEGVKWISQDEISRQLEILAKAHVFEYVKIGLIENLSVLLQVVNLLHEINSSVKIIWDPILKASAGYEFHADLDQELVINICSKLLLITPNIPEMVKLIPGIPAYEGARLLSEYTSVLLKGGHSDADIVKDTLFENGRIYTFEGTRSEYSKHGTGCVLSAAILTNLAKDYDLPDACREAKDYVSEFINSHGSLLGFHYV